MQSTDTLTHGLEVFEARTRMNAVGPGFDCKMCHLEKQAVTGTLPKVEKEVESMVIEIAIE